MRYLRRWWCTAVDVFLLPEPCVGLTDSGPMWLMTLDATARAAAERRCAKHGGGKAAMSPKAGGSDDRGGKVRSSTSVMCAGYARSTPRTDADERKTGPPPAGGQEGAPTNAQKPCCY